MKILTLDYQDIEITLLLLDLKCYDLFTDMHNINNNAASIHSPVYTNKSTIYNEQNKLTTQNQTDFNFLEGTQILDQKYFPRPAPRFKFPRLKTSEFKKSQDNNQDEKQTTKYKPTTSVKEEKEVVHEAFEEILSKPVKENKETANESQIGFDFKCDDNFSKKNFFCEENKYDIKFGSAENIYENSEFLRMSLKSKKLAKSEQNPVDVPLPFVRSRSAFQLRTALSAKNESQDTLEDTSRKKTYVGSHKKEGFKANKDYQLSYSPKFQVWDPFLTQDPFENQPQECFESDETIFTHLCPGNKERGKISEGIKNKTDFLSVLNHLEDFCPNDNAFLESRQSITPKSMHSNYLLMDRTKVHPPSSHPPINENHFDSYVEMEAPRVRSYVRKSVLNEFDPLLETKTGKEEKEFNSNYLSEKALQIRMTENGFKGEPFMPQKFSTDANFLKANKLSEESEATFISDANGDMLEVSQNNQKCEDEDEQDQKIYKDDNNTKNKESLHQETFYQDNSKCKYTPNSWPFEKTSERYDEASASPVSSSETFDLHSKKSSLGSSSPPSSPEKEAKVTSKSWKIGRSEFYTIDTEVRNFEKKNIG